MTTRVVLRQGTVRPCAAGVRRPLIVGALMNNMICIQQRDENIDIQRRSHRSDALLLHPFSEVIESDHVTAARENRDGILRPL